ncbi:MAG TPA: hypothetical protein VJM31_18090 [Vicinamibacterales bacterium]|nr:hypothetical protein [Vicinamibacterales bacterium]
MPDFNIRTDAVDVEQIMRQIRARIQEKRGVDYTEQQIQELANVKLERFLDPKGVRSDLVEQFKRARDRKIEPFQPEQYTVDANDLYGSSRGLVRLIRSAFNPLLKLLLNANRLVQVLHQQMEINKLYEKQFHLLREKSQQRDEVDVLYYELVHNLVLELTRVGIENRNLKMRLESLSSRMDFDERRARALEGVVQFRPGTGPAREPVRPPARSVNPPVRMPPPPVAASQPAAEEPLQGAQPLPQAVLGTDEHGSESGTTRRRRRRRRGRRGGRGRLPGEIAAPGTPAEVSSREDSATPPHGDPTADAALEREDGEPEFDAGSDSGEGEGSDPSEQ